MEQTVVENAAAEARGSQVSSFDLGLSLARLVDAWARAGASVPIAIVASIFDDLLGDENASQLARDGGSLRFEDVVIDPNGVAHLGEHARARASVDAIAVLV